MSITLPSGRKIRSASQRRFVLISDGQREPRIIKRSDNLAGLRVFRVKNNHFSAVIVDQRSGEVV